MRYNWQTTVPKVVTFTIEIHGNFIGEYIKIPEQINLKMQPMSTIFLEQLYKVLVSSHELHKQRAAYGEGWRQIWDRVIGKDSKICQLVLQAKHHVALVEIVIKDMVGAETEVYCKSQNTKRREKNIVHPPTLNNFAILIYFQCRYQALIPHMGIFRIIKCYMHKIWIHSHDNNHSIQIMPMIFFANCSHCQTNWS